MAVYAVGDIQSCFDEFEQLLKLINFGEHDQLWLAGDLVNRGPKTLDTLRFCYRYAPQLNIVLGNHDLHLLAVARGGAKLARKDTLNDVLNSPDRDTLLDWLQQQPLLHHDALTGFTMTHAGIPPSWSLAQAQARAEEVHQALIGEHSGQFLERMYGNKPARWSNDLEGIKRLRCITNYFTRMRFCDANDRLDFASKETPDHPPSGYLPWFSQPHRAMADQPIVFGHWAALMGQSNTPNVHALDTGCVWGGSLTAMRLDNLQRFSVPSTTHI